MIILSLYGTEHCGRTQSCTRYVTLFSHQYWYDCEASMTEHSTHSSSELMLMLLKDCFCYKEYCPCCEGVFPCCEGVFLGMIFFLLSSELKCMWLLLLVLDVAVFFLFQQPLLRRILKEAIDETFERFAAEVKDQFELCLAKCRTSSQVIYLWWHDWWM